jgi:hypothetical protein
VIAAETLPIPRTRPAEAARVEGAKRYFFGPVRDFLLLGGSSLFLLPLALLLPNSSRDAVWLLTALVALVINHPHFANSYQLFYRDFRDRASSPDRSRGLRYRYLFAGIALPVLLAGFLALCLALGDFRTLGIAANAMTFFVGWHYVKQGYGMLIVDGVLKRNFFRENEKKVLTVNAYAVWALAWISANTYGSDVSIWGIDYYLLSLPQPFLYTAAGVAALTSALAAFVLLSRFRAGQGLPLNGLVAYLITLYLWMVFVRIDPIWLLIVPALHSLQYLTVVWRYESNRQKALSTSSPPSEPSQRPPRRNRRLTLFIVWGILLGILGFWLVPGLLHVVLPVSAAPAESSAFLFVFWIFINVHHYFIDNVIWRSDNPEVKQYLFS